MPPSGCIGKGWHVLGDNNRGAGLSEDGKHAALAVCRLVLCDLMLPGRSGLEVLVVPIGGGGLFAVQPMLMNRMPGHIALSGQFATWSGTILGIRSTPVLVADTDAQIEELVKGTQSKDQTAGWVEWVVERQGEKITVTARLWDRPPPGP